MLHGVSTLLRYVLWWDQQGGGLPPQKWMNFAIWMSGKEESSVPVSIENMGWGSTRCLKHTAKENFNNRQKLWLKRSRWIETMISSQELSKDKDTGSALLCRGASSVVITRTNWQGRFLKSQAVLTVLIKASIGRKKAPDSYSLSWWTGKSESRWHRRGFALLFFWLLALWRRVLTVLDAN